MCILLQTVKYYKINSHSSKAKQLNKHKSNNKNNINMKIKEIVNFSAVLTKGAKCSTDGSNKTIRSTKSQFR